jgi:anti-anti-sigma factor
VSNHDLRPNPLSFIVPTLDVHISSDGAASHVVTISGELDVRSRQYVEHACLEGDDPVVVLEMSALTFMDCCGYAGLVAARRVLEGRGGSLTFSNQDGQPARLLVMLGAVDTVGTR